jgi:hypothetical protein
MRAYWFYEGRGQSFEETVNEYTWEKGLKYPKFKERREGFIRWRRC